MPCSYNSGLPIVYSPRLESTRYMVLYIIGLGLGNEKDITVHGLETIKRCSLIYLETYTSVLGVNKSRLESFYGHEIIEADREFVEQSIDEMVESAKISDIAFLVVGDPFGATTHADLVIRARGHGTPVDIIHNASIMNAIGVAGLQLYHYGQTVSIPFWTETWCPDSFYDKIKQNKDIGLHTLCLLDIKVKEQSFENLLRGRKIFESPRFMSVGQCISQILRAEEKRRLGVLTDGTMCVGIARVGQANQQIVSGTLKQLEQYDFGEPLHSLVICGQMHDMELEYIRYYQVENQVGLQ